MFKRSTTACLAMLLFATLAAPLAASASPPSRLHAELNRIQAGYKNGSLNKTQYKTDLVRWRGIRRQMRHDWRRSDGPLKTGQRQVILRDESRLGERIHDQRQRPPQ